MSSMTRITMDNKLYKYGFSHKRNSVHVSRTIMIDELCSLFDTVAECAKREEYQYVIIEKNCLNKRSNRTRQLTYQHLAELYSLDYQYLIFRVMRWLWARDIDGQPLLALLCAYARDDLFRSTSSFILNQQIGEVVTRESLEKYIETKNPDRFSKSTLKSAAQNINASWTKSGHLRGKVKKIRSQANATPGSVTYALLLGYLQGLRGIMLFESEYARILDCSMERCIELAQIASGYGWIHFKHIGDVYDVHFPQWTDALEVENEQQD